MASLKEVKDRIDSVKSTMKITSAMKMIASAKLRKSHQAIASFLPYSTKLNEILVNLLASDSSIDLPYAKQREVGRVAIVAFTSNTSLCGAFNANVLKELSLTISDLSSKMGKDNIVIYPIGKKVADYSVKRGFKVHQEDKYLQMADKPEFNLVKELADDLVSKFLYGEFDRIILIYTHSNSAASLVVRNVEYLPFDLDLKDEDVSDAKEQNIQADYILEPSTESLLSLLIPKVLASNLYAALLDSNASENAARSMAMQIATDNARELVDDLTIEYNKSRQAAITGELLDIIGGTSALK